MDLPRRPRLVLCRRNQTLRRTCPFLLSTCKLRQLFWIIVFASLVSRTQAQKEPDLTQKSLEDLMNVEVTSVSRKGQKTSQAAAAVFVISRQDIARSGATNIPELLRMVPGVEVAQLDNHTWAISVRGFNGQESNKLLVLVDGRTVYNPIFAGVFWDSQNIPLDTIERIEVIRGPGAAVWGDNAVNGTINIITRPAKDTQGGYISGAAGTLGGFPETVRYGGSAGRIGSYRVYAEGFDLKSQRALGGGSGLDDWQLIHGGFRTDTSLNPRDSLTAEGEVYHGNGGEQAYTPVTLYPPATATVALRDRYSGWNMLSRWTRVESSQSQTSLQAYFDRTTRGDTTYSLGINTFDLDFQQHIGWGRRQDLVWGGGYRVSSDATAPTIRISFTPHNRVLQLFSLFGQDEVALDADRLFLTVGARLEHNSYTGFDLEPSVQLVWQPEARSMYWASASGADRTPARSDRDIRVDYQALPGPAGLPILISDFGSPEQKNEQLIAFEAGYRHTWSDKLSLDATAFFNQYHDLESVEPMPTRLESDPAPVHLLIPFEFGNGLYGETHGFEAFANWKPASFWTLSPGYSFLTVHIHRFAYSQDTTDGPGTEGGVPNHQAMLRSQVMLPNHLQWNTSAFFVDRLAAVAVPSYTRMDSGLTWQRWERWSVSVMGQNLLRASHQEFAGPDSSVLPGLMRRDVYGRISWAF
jgi:iron complex outermembrane receptor protein